MRLSNDDVVYQTLRNEQRSMSAYGILAALKGTNIKAAVQVYRALDKLIAQRKVHRIASLNAFVACSCEAHDSPPGFFICSSCGATTEFDPRPGLGAISGAAAGFRVEDASVELRGLCANCANGEASRL